MHFHTEKGRHSQNISSYTFRPIEENAVLSFHTNLVFQCTVENEKNYENRKKGIPYIKFSFA